MRLFSARPLTRRTRRLPWPRQQQQLIKYRVFHDYFLAHFPSSSAHPDAHKLPRKESSPHDPTAIHRPAVATVSSSAREVTVARVPILKAAHHFGVFGSRGQRPYNEDTFQAGTIELPAFAKSGPKSVQLKPTLDDMSSATSSTGDPQVFYFGIFDGHGGTECSDFLRDSLHDYLEDASQQFRLPSTLPDTIKPNVYNPDSPLDCKQGDPSQNAKENALNLQKSLFESWKVLVGGYFERLQRDFLEKEARGRSNTSSVLQEPSIESVVQYAFLKADYDFMVAQAKKSAKQPVDGEQKESEKVLDTVNERPIAKQIGGKERFIGGSTCSIAVISTPTPTPFWNPNATLTLLIAHCGDTRIILCETATGRGKALTSTHHPDDPMEASRMRRYTTSFATDSFGEARVGGLANSRSFGDMKSKRLGISAEPEIVKLELEAGKYSFMVLMSDGVSGQLSDQIVCDIIKEAKTPDQGSKNVVNFATEISSDGDNATVMVVRLGGWERRNEGCRGSLGTKEHRDFLKQQALDPRSRRQ